MSLERSQIQADEYKQNLSRLDNRYRKKKQEISEQERSINQLKSQNSDLQLRVQEQTGLINELTQRASAGAPSQISQNEQVRTLALGTVTALVVHQLLAMTALSANASTILIAVALLTLAKL